MDTEEEIIILLQRITKLENDMNSFKNRNNKYLLFLLLFIIIFNYFENTTNHKNKSYIYYDLLLNLCNLIRYSTLSSLVAFIMIIFI